MTFTIKGDKTATGRPLCETCDRAAIMRGMRLGEAVTYCDKTGERLTFRVYDCTAYRQRGTPPLWRMENMAWNLLADKKGRTIGFCSPSKTKELVDEGKVEYPSSLDND